MQARKSIKCFFRASKLALTEVEDGRGCTAFATKAYFENIV
jgi:hypothetical protein